MEDFVQATLANRVKTLPRCEDKVMWFKNRTALQSVASLEYVHVLVRNALDSIVSEWTGGE